MLSTVSYLLLMLMALHALPYAWSTVILDTARDLGKRGLIPQTEVEAADVAVLMQDSSIRSSVAGLNQAQANLNQQQVNLNHTVIKAPIDG